MAQESWKEAEDTGVHAPEAPIMCMNNCGFFGNRMTENMCSKCYRDTVKAKKMALLVENKTAAAVASSPTPLVAEIKDEASASAKEGKQVAEEEAPKPPSNRCLSCRKKVGLTGFKCRCGDTFCSMHRYADAHDCKFDYKQAGREQIAQQNPVVKADKVTRF
ncbi:zinc finger A20 and AN1 domain-containing stress-associated protein 6 [Triticum aestivum]|uniref:zinc finger A20 and AN1 domain-containing stress-associated protein 6 n=1 Tax=Triticum aestivum TaxID=4565 RepID=UPI0008445482|nr:zinc finger A20 and AN1 domain-containing stress-associated protein 6-like [Triticum aestivum]XP_044390856.1 zinc finger A20 and AN1 domain-containing stress-associated protein 6-like [Triticum aestivum]